MVLDSRQKIKTIDKQNMLESVIGLPDQIESAWEETVKISIPTAYSTCKQIVVIGMGCSGIPGDFLKAIYFNKSQTPIFIHKDYGLPSYIGKDSLVLAVSYSGTTEETLDAFDIALKRKAKIFGISSGDKLLQLLKKHNLPHFAPPSGRTTRECLGYLLFPMIAVLESLGYIPIQQAEISETLAILRKISKALSPEILEEDNVAKRIAHSLQNKIAAIYGSSDLTEVVALRWKQQLNENSKVFAYRETFPDLTHNQLAAISNPHGLDKQIYAIFLRNHFERPELARRIDAAKEVVISKNIQTFEHFAEGKSLMAALLSQSYVGDFTSLYLAFLDGIDPTPTVAMSELKKLLGLTDLSPL